MNNTQKRIWKKCGYISCKKEPRRPQSSRKPETGIGEKEVRQGEHHMQLGRNFFDAVIAYLTTFEQVFHNTKAMFDLTPDGRFLMFGFSGFPLTAFAELIQRGGTAHHLIFDLFPLLVSFLGFGPFFSAGIAAVSIDFILIPMNQFIRHGNIGDIGGCWLHGMHNAGIHVHANMGFIPEIPGIALLGLMRFRVTFLFSFFVDEGAGMIVESTIVPFRRINPSDSSIRTTSSNRFF